MASASIPTIGRGLSATMSQVSAPTRATGTELRNGNGLVVATTAWPGRPGDALDRGGRFPNGEEAASEPWSLNGYFASSQTTVPGPAARPRPKVSQRPTPAGSAQ